MELIVKAVRLLRMLRNSTLLILLLCGLPVAALAQHLHLSLEHGYSPNQWDTTHIPAIRLMGDTAIRVGYYPDSAVGKIWYLRDSNFVIVGGGRYNEPVRLDDLTAQTYYLTFLHFSFPLFATRRNPITTSAK